MPDTTVVIATRDRRAELRSCLDRLGEPGGPAVIVVDNGSSDGTPPLVRGWYPHVTVVALPDNAGAAARTVGARLAGTRWVAFCDDDSWWEPGSLEVAESLLAADPRVGLIAARVLVEPGGRTDPTSELMAGGTRNEWLRPSPVGRRGVTGFLACAAVVRRSAYLATGGFAPRFVIGAEEELVALDLADSGWKLVYAPEVVVHHEPSTRRQAAGRRRRIAANSALTAALRYSGRGAARRLSGLVGDAGRDLASWRGLGDASRSLGWALAGRRPVGAQVEEAFVPGGAGGPGRP